MAGERPLLPALDLLGRLNDLLAAARLVVHEGEHCSGVAFSALCRAVEAYDKDWRCVSVMSGMRCELGIGHKEIISGEIVHRSIDGMQWPEAPSE